MKKIVALALCLVMVFGLMTGCQKAMDAKTVYQNMTEAMKAVTAQSADVEMDLEMKMSTMGMTMTIGMVMDMTSMAKSDLSSMYMDMNMEMKMLGETEEMKMEMYGAMEDSAMVYYTYDSTEDLWVKTSMDEYADMVNKLNGMSMQLSDATSDSLFLAKLPETINDRKCYKLTEQIDGAAIQEQMGDYMFEVLNQMTGAEELDEESMAQVEAVLKGLDWSKLSGSVVYYVDTESFLPVEMSVEILGMGDVFNSAIGALMEQMAAEYEEYEEEIPEISIDVPAFKISSKNMTYNDDVQIPELPQEAIDNAIDADAIPGFDEELDSDTELLNPPQADGSYLMTMGSNSVRVMLPEGYTAVSADNEMIIGMSEDMLNYVSYALMPEMTGEDMRNNFVEEIIWAQTEDYYKSHSDVEELNGFATASLIYNDDTSIWYAWKELDGGVLMMYAEVEGEVYDLGTLLSSVEIAVN